MRGNKGVIVIDYENFLTWEKESPDCIDFKRLYYVIAGNDLHAGILLSQIIYWHLPSKKNGLTKLQIKKHGHYWLVKRRKDWLNECCLKPTQFDRASKILVKRELIVKKVYKYKNSPTTHIRLDIDRLSQYLSDALANTSDILDINDLRILKLVNR